MPLFGGDEYSTSSSGEEEDEDEESSDDELSVNNDEDGSLESDKLTVSEKESNGKTRTALPPLNTATVNSSLPHTRENEKMDKTNDLKNNPPKIFPLTP